VRALLKNWNNPIGIALAVLHATILLVVIASRKPLPPPDPSPTPCPPDAVCLDLSKPFAGETLVARRAFHYGHEPLLVKLLMLSDMPAMLVGAIVVLPVSLLLLLVGVSVQSSSYVTAVLWLFSGSIQWWAIGTRGYLTWRLPANTPLQPTAEKRGG
jgi:hypothetical protein